MKPTKKRLIDCLSFRTRNLPVETLTLWNAQLILTCYDPYVRFSQLPDDIILRINKWLMAALVGGIRPADDNDELFQPLSPRNTRLLRLKTWAEFCDMPKDWIEGIDDNMCPFVSTYRDRQTGLVSHRVARFRISNDDFCAFKRVRAMAKAALNTYCDFSNRIEIERKHTFVYRSPHSGTTPDPPVERKCTMLYFMIGTTTKEIAPWAWKQLREEGAKQLKLWRHDHEEAKRIGRQLYDIIMLAKRPKNC